MNNKSRRSFLAQSALGLSSAWLATNWSGILEARAYADQTASGPSPDLSFLTDGQAADIDAMASQIIPTDDTPGAHEARCVYFIDRALTTFQRDSQQVYLDGLRDLQAKTTEIFPDADSFASLSSEQQIRVMKAIEHTKFFAAVRTHTITGMFASPAHGGNHDKAGWKLIGFDDALHFDPPFGYYDAAGNGGQ